MAQIDTKEDSVVAVYQQHPDAEQAVNLLNKGNFNVKNVAIVGRGDQTTEQVVGFYSTGDRIRHWGKNGAFWGGMLTLLVGGAFWFIPGVGLVMIAGSTVSWLVGALEAAVAVGGLSALGAALYSHGVPKDSALKYENSVKAGQYLVIAHGTAEEVETARRILSDTQAEEINVHQPGQQAVAV